MKAPRPTFSFAILIAFLLMFTQQIGAIHPFSHFEYNQKNQQEKHSPNTKACEECLVFAKIGSGLPASAIVFHIAPVIQNLTPAIFAGLARLESPAYRSRAPPVIS
ncbi:MAG: hypothetical protein V4568_03175 [Pseudomonadota bacterium]